VIAAGGITVRLTSSPRLRLRTAAVRLGPRPPTPHFLPVSESDHVGASPFANSLATSSGIRKAIMTVAIAPSVVSASAWRRIQTSLTAVLLVVGTGAGIAVAAQAPAVSPVSPPAVVVPAVPGAVTTLTGPTPAGVRGNPALHADHNGPSGDAGRGRRA